MALGSKKTTETKSRATRTVSQILEDQSKEAERVRKEQEENGNPVQENVKTNDQKEIAIETEMLQRSQQIGEALSTHEEFNADMDEVVKAKEVDDSKATTTLGWMERFLSKEQLDLLPWPGSTKAEAEAKRKPGSNMPLIFDKPKASGGRVKVETFYSNLVKHTKRGKVAAQYLETIGNTPLPKEATSLEAEDRETEIENANRVLNQMLSAVKMAAKIRIQLNEFKEKIPHIHISWVRTKDIEMDDYPEDTDWTNVYIPNAPPVKAAKKVLVVYNTRVQNPTRHRYAVGTFLRWKVDRALEIAEKDGRKGKVNMDDLEKSATKAPPEQDPNKTPAATGATITVTKAKRYEATNVTEAFDCLAGFVGYHDTHKLTDKPIHHQAVLDMINNSDEGLASAFAVWATLEPIFASSPALRERAQNWLKEMEKKTA